jgi:hypothetical protein
VRFGDAALHPIDVGLERGRGFCLGTIGREQVGVVTTGMDVVDRLIVGDTMLRIVVDITSQ